jgi:AP-3 complex subunit mu
MAVIQILRFLNQLASEYYGTSASGFSVLSEQLVRDNASGILQIVEEALDDGRPAWSEEAVIRDLVPPPSILSNIVQALGGPVSFANPANKQAGPTLPTLSNIPWRNAGVRHMNNELFLDIVEDLDVLIDGKTGTVVLGEVRGVIRCDCRLSGGLQQLYLARISLTASRLCFQACPILSLASSNQLSAMSTLICFHCTRQFG